VTGSIDPARILANAGARAGDVLFLTKPLGTGIVGTAIKFDRAESALADAAVRSMLTLNRAAAEALQPFPGDVIHACTDITGFGLIGHASEIAAASQVTVTIQAGHVPAFEGVLALAGANQSGGLGSNEAHFGQTVEVEPGVDQDRLTILYDPQTSGGLLIAVSSHSAERVRTALTAAGVPAIRVGSVGPAMPGRHVVVRP
jgi:selenide,water dikinase